MSTGTERLKDILRDAGKTPDAFQRFWLRWIVTGFAVSFIFLLGYLEYYLLACLRHTKLGQGDLFMVLCIVPVVASTAIVVFMLIGVFRSPRDGDMSELPMDALRNALLSGDS